MHNKSPIPVKWADERCSLAWALQVEVCQHGATVSCSYAWFFSPIHPQPKTHSHRDRLWCHPPKPVPLPPPPPFLPFPLPCQHKPVMWLSQIMRWEFYCSSLWAWHQSVRRTTTQASVCPLWYRAPSVVCCELTLDAQGALSSPQGTHFKVGDQGLTCAWHPENDNASVSIRLLLRARPRDTMACRLLPHYIAPWRKSLFRRGIYI